MGYKDESAVLRERLKALRIKRGMTQRELADRLEVSDRTYSKWETGEIELSLGSLYKLSEIFSVPLSELLANKSEAIFELGERSDEAHIDASEFFSVLGSSELLRLLSNIFGSGAGNELFANSSDKSAELLCIGEGVGIFEKRMVHLGAERTQLFRIKAPESLLEILKLTYSRLESQRDSSEV